MLGGSHRSQRYIRFAPRVRVSAGWYALTGPGAAQRCGTSFQRLVCGDLPVLKYLCACYGGGCELIFGKKRRLAAPVLTAPRDSFRWEDHLSAGSVMERRLYQSLRESVPLIDAALYRIERLIGGFSVECPQQEAQQGLQSCFRSVRRNARHCGNDSFFTG